MIEDCFALDEDASPRVDDDSDDEEGEPSPRKLIEREEARCANTPLGRFEQSKPWQTFVISAIMANTAELAWQANMLASLDSPDDADTRVTDVFDNVFLVIFVVDLLLRLLVYKCNFFCNSTRGWNWFDSLVVALGVLDQWVVPVMFADGQNSPLKNFKTLRLLRVMRAVRLFNKFPQLNRLLIGLVGSTQSVFWIGIMFLFLVFTSSIFVTNMVGLSPGGLDAFDEDDKAAIKSRFGSIGRSMITLSIFLTFDDWSTPARMINEKYPWMEYFWVWYLVMGGFFIVSLLTGLMADQMMGAREHTDEKERVNPADVDRELKKLKSRLGLGDVIGPNEFKKLMTTPYMKKTIAVTNLVDPTFSDDDAHVKWLFDSFDRAGTGKLNYRQLRTGFMQISRHAAANGNASVLEVMKLEGRLSKLDRIMEREVAANDPSAQDSWDRRLENVHARANLLKERSDALQEKLKDFLHKQGFPSQ